MLAYTTYSEGGGVGKSTSAATLAAAHVRAGLDTLLIGLDQQEGDVSHMLGVDDDRAENVDNLARHMIRRGKGPFEDLIRTTEGIDIIPEHNELSNLESWLEREKKQAEEMGEAFGKYRALRRVLKEANVPENYDVLIVDPPAKESAHLYNAIDATRSILLPFEPSAKGEATVQGLESMVKGLEDQLNITVGVLAALPIGFEDTNDQREILENLKYSHPVTIRKRKSMMEGAWRRQCSPFKFVAEHRDRIRQRELDTLAQYDELARYLENQAGIEAPNPPEPGDIEHKVVA